MNDTNNKNSLRRSCRQKRDGFGEEFIQKASANACKILAERKEFSNAETVLLYFPVKNEISPLPIFELALHNGKSIAFPVCNKKDNTLTFRKVTSLCEPEDTDFGLYEPKFGCEEIRPDARTLCVVPALAFSRDGHRLGYGGGYYDRFLKDFQGVSVGFAYSELLLPDIPNNSHDVPVNMIITESEVLYIA